MTTSKLVSGKSLLGAKVRAVIYMAAANSVHFGGYELARSGLLALFTSHRTGFLSTSSVSFATGCVTPFAVALLWAHTNLSDRIGPQSALRFITLVVAIQLAVVSVTLDTIDPLLETSVVYRWVSKAVLFALFVSQSAFVQLLFSQHWSFLSSVLTEDEGAVWFAPIAGFGSLVSTVIAWQVLPTVDRIGLTGLLKAGSLLLFLCALCSDRAYSIADANGFAPSQRNTTPKGVKEGTDPINVTLLSRAIALFKRRPVLGALCCEVILCQCQSSLLSYLFISSTKLTFTNDDDRARFTGNFYSWVNLASSFLQFFLLPPLLKYLDRKRLWLVIPFITFLSSAWILLTGKVSLPVIAMSFGIYKALEYSLRGAITEMIYVSLDYESRFLGKEIVSLVANRIGKSGTAIGLSFVASQFAAEFERYTPAILLGVSSIWLFVSFRMVKYLSEKVIKIS